MIDDTLNEIRQYAQKKDLNRFSLAKKAGLGINTLKNLNKPDWCPTAETIRKLEHYIYHREGD